METEVISFRFSNSLGELNDETYLINFKDFKSILNSYYEVIQEHSADKEFNPEIYFEKGSLIINARMMMSSAAFILHLLSTNLSSMIQIENYSNKDIEFLKHVNLMLDNHDIEIFSHSLNSIYNQNNSIQLDKEHKFEFSKLTIVDTIGYLTGIILGINTNGFDDDAKGNIQITSNDTKYTLKLNYEDLIAYDLKLGEFVVILAKYNLILENLSIDKSRTIEVLKLDRIEDVNIQEANKQIEINTKKYWNDPIGVDYMLSLRGVNNE